MKETTMELALSRWPYGLEVQPSPDGLLLRPRRKARASWRASFRNPRFGGDDLAATRQFVNAFDAKEWQW